MTTLSRRRLFGVASAVAAGVSFGPQAWAQAKDRLVIGMSLEPPVLDPTRNAAAAIREVTCPSIFESLGRIDRTGAIGPGLAGSWTISPDGKEYAFKLRSGVKFHDGEAMDAAVVKFTLDRLFAADSTNPAKSLYADIEKVEAVDPATVKVTLKSPNSYMLYNLSLGDAGVMHPKTAATNDKNPVGTGPYRFKERKEGDSITLEKSPTYRDQSEVALKTVIFKVVKDPSAQVNALLAGPTHTENTDRLRAERARAQGISLAEIEAGFFRDFRPTSLLKRFTSADEVANLGVYLCSEAASGTSGAAMRVDGGVVNQIM